jgi:membrane protease YdiL (CAAX protease family)
MLRSLWQSFFKFNWSFGLVLVLLFGIPRFIIVLNANVTGKYSLVPFIFILMAIAPIIFLTKGGRMNIGMRKASNYRWLLYSFLLGMIACAIMFIAAKLFFANSIDNWFVYISKSYTVPKNLTDSDRLIYFIIYAMTGITFSPTGEELFYRGIVHGGFATSMGEQKASTTDSLAFAITHLAHFGIVYVSGQWSFLFLPSLLWLLFMFAVSKLFFVCKIKTGSIWGAILSHAGFNLAMMYFIFYYVFD